MKLNTSLIAVALTMVTTSAFADQVFNEPIDLPTTKNFGLFVLESGGSFTDIINFGLISQSQIKAVNVSNVIPNGVASSHDWHISDAQVQLFNSSNIAVGSSWVYDGDTGTVDHNYNLGAGNYYFKVTGNADGTGLNFGSSVPKGNYTFSVTSVPEPESYAMMLAGLGLMGFVAARRKV